MELNDWIPYAKIYEPIAVGSIDGSDTQPHDRAIIRAIENKYVPNKRIKGDPACTLFVGRLHPEVTSEELKEIFSEYGTIKSCIVVRDVITQLSRQYGFIEFEKYRHADRAYRHSNKTIVRGAEILVDWEVGRTLPGWKPRSLGGGFGGRKESGQLRFGCRDRPWSKPITFHSKNKGSFTDSRSGHEHHSSF